MENELSLKEEITRSFLDGVQDCREFHESLEIIRGNSSGKIWLVGGFLYRTIASGLYGLPKSDCDFDFIVEVPVAVQEMRLPAGWTVKKNHFGHPKLVEGRKRIDYIPLKEVYSIVHRRVEASIENFLSGVPLTVQSIAYDIYENRIIGEKGIDAILRKVVEVNNLYFAEYYADYKKKRLPDLIKEKAETLEFTPVLPDYLKQSL